MSLRGANLRGANLSGAHLSSVDLTDASLTWADLRNVTAHESTFVNADLSYADLTKASLAWSKLGGANLSQAKMVFTDLFEADIAGCRIFGISAWGVKLGGTKQSNLIITREDEATVTVDNLEIAQFIYLLRNNERIRHAIDTITSKVVLILGRFTEERKPVLDAIRVELRRRDYLPVLFDFQKPDNKDLTGTVTTLANMARFIIADLTDLEQCAPRTGYGCSRHGRPSSDDSVEWSTRICNVRRFEAQTSLGARTVSIRVWSSR